MKLTCTKCGAVVSVGKLAQRLGEVPDPFVCPECLKKAGKREAPAEEERPKRGSRFNG